jgi:hypothetical protein
VAGDVVVVALLGRSKYSGTGPFEKTEDPPGPYESKNMNAAMLIDAYADEIRITKPPNDVFEVLAVVAKSLRSSSRPMSNHGWLTVETRRHAARLRWARCFLRAASASGWGLCADRINSASLRRGSTATAFA